MRGAGSNLCNPRRVRTAVVLTRSFFPCRSTFWPMLHRLFGTGGWCGRRIVIVADCADDNAPIFFSGGLAE
jgi:hypothetical protein